MNKQIEKAFFEYFKLAPRVVIRSPGRINLIGEHTDYNQGFVLPAAIDKSIFLAFSPRNDNEIHLNSINLKDSYSTHIGTLGKSDSGWPNYILGVVQQLLLKSFKIQGFNCTFGGNIPIGSGLSSSAALECGTLRGLQELFNLEIAPKELALMGQAAENQFVGVNCGIMDQFANVFGRKDHLIKLDCSNLNYDYVPFTANHLDILLCETGIKHDLASSEYNLRRRQCENGVKALQAIDPNILSLRDAKMNQLEAVKAQLSDDIFRRCRYVISEIERVSAACKDLKENRFEDFGAKMYATHEGLKNDYSVSCDELDFLVDQAMKTKAVLGARLMGGGFGGCTINLIQKNETEAFLKNTEKVYREKFNRNLIPFIVQIADGVEVL